LVLQRPDDEADRRDMTTGGAIAVVTGGAGFIGSHMVDCLLDRGYCVRVVDNLSGGQESNLVHHAGNPDLALEQLNICDLAPGASVFKGARFVFHFAGIGDIVPSIERPAEYMATNVQGTVRVLEAARAAKISKLVYAASSSCYGLAATPTREDHPIAPQYPYALSKYLGEQAAFHWYQVYRLPVNSIRIFNAYGTRVRTTGSYGAVFGVFFKQKLAGKPFTVVGDGSQRRDFLYVSDVAEAFLRAAETPRTGEIWNLGAGKPQSINRLVELIGGPVTYIPKRPGEPDVTWADIGKIRRELGWRANIGFEEGVGRMIAEIDKWHDAPLWDAALIACATRIWFDHLGSKEIT
jgi:UDP-glucose 4-epimerase